MMNMISVCMIVKNEEELLALAVGSTVGLADEVCVLDTGSDDNTVEVATELGCSVFIGGDHMNKGAARNEVAGHAKGDWIVVLDADEIIADPGGLRAHIEATEFDALYVKMDDGVRSWDQLRVYRRGMCEYKYRAHELPVPTGKTERTPFVFEHNQPADRWAWKLDYTLKRLQLDVKENPKEARPRYYLGRQRVYLKQYSQAITELKRFLKLDPNGWDAPNACVDIALCVRHLGKEGYITWLYKACETQPLNRYPWYLIALEYYSMGRYELAYGLIRNVIEIKTEVGYTKTDMADVHDLAARALWKLGRIHEGSLHATRATVLRPGDKRLVDNLGYFYTALAGESAE